jgi:hypothetical protein
MSDRDELLAIVAGLAEADPGDSCTTYDDGSRWCHFCDAMAEWPHENDPLAHKDDCLWVRARAAVAGSATPTGDDDA